MARKGFYFDQTRCIGCRTCQVACKDKNDLQVGVVYRRVESYEIGKYPNATIYHVTQTCNHCENPECVRVCPAGAMHVDEADGTVQHDAEICIGCQNCVNSCPYQVPQYLDDQKISGKCDACFTLRGVGEGNACVTACPMRALDFDDIDELKKKYPNGVNDIAVMPDPSVTNPSLVIAAKEQALDESYAETLI